MIVVYLLVAVLLIFCTVIVHEYGHLRSCRRHGIAVEEFSFGVGKTLKTWTTKKGLKVNWKLLPVGGSVSPAGMTVEEVEEKALPKETSYIYASPIARFRITAAGIGYNVLFAMLLQVFIIPVILKPATWSEWAAIPGTIFWATLVILGAFIGLIVQAPLTGFSEVNSVIKLPEGLENTVNLGSEQGLSIFMVLALAWMSLNLFMAILNALPIYPLDGFFLATSVMDWARKRIHGDDYSPLPYSRLEKWARAGFVSLLTLALFLIVRDVVRMIY